MSDYIPKFNPGHQIPVTVATDVIGGRLVEVVTPGEYSVRPAVADSLKVLGVAAQDKTAGSRVTVFTRAAGVHSLVASGPIAAGDSVAAAAAGKVKTATAAGSGIALALTAASADNDVIDVIFI